MAKIYSVVKSASNLWENKLNNVIKNYPTTIHRKLNTHEGYVHEPCYCNSIRNKDNENSIEFSIIKYNAQVTYINNTHLNEKNYLSNPVLLKTIYK